MKKAVLLVPVIALVLASTAFAQVGVATDKDKSDAVKVTIGVTSDLNWVYRDTWINAVRGGGTLAGSGEGWTGNFLTASPTSFITNYTVVRLDVALGTNVKAVVELGTDPINDEAQVSFAGPGATDTGTLMGNTLQTVRFWNLYAELADAWVSGMTIRAGQIHTTFDLRGRGTSLVYDSFWAPPPERNFVNGPFLNSNIEDVASAGAVVNYKQGAVSLEAGLFPVVQQFTPTAPSDGSSTYYASFFYSNSEGALQQVSKNSRLGLIALLMHLPENGSVYAIGGGVDVSLLENDALELFGEAYFNGGKVNDLKAKGKAYELGLRYNIQNMEQKPWVEVKMMWLSGDDSATDTSVKNYISMQYQRDLLILEDPVFGLGINTNLNVISLGGGVTFKTGGENNLTLSGILGLAKMMKGVDVGVPLSSEKTLGNEFDIKAEYNFSKAVNFNAGLAYLFSSDVIEGLTTQSAARKGEDTSWLFTLGASLKW